MVRRPLLGFERNVCFYFVRREKRLVATASDLPQLLFVAALFLFDWFAAETVTFCQPLSAYRNYSKRPQVLGKKVIPLTTGER